MKRKAVIVVEYIDNAFETGEEVPWEKEITYIVQGNYDINIKKIDVKFKSVSEGA